MFALHPISRCDLVTCRAGACFKPRSIYRRLVYPPLIVTTSTELVKPARGVVAAILTRESEDAQWQSFFTAAPTVAA